MHSDVSKLGIAAAKSIGARVEFRIPGLNLRVDSRREELILRPFASGERDVSLWLSPHL
jgi:hypothetical protein